MPSGTVREKRNEVSKIPTIKMGILLLISRKGIAQLVVWAWNVRERKKISLISYTQNRGLLI